MVPMAVTSSPRCAHLSHLPMQGDGREAEVAQHEGDTLRIGARAAEDHEGVASELIEDVHEVDVLEHKHDQPLTPDITASYTRR